MEDEIKTENVETAEVGQSESALTDTEVKGTNDDNEMREIKDAVREMQSDIREIKNNAVAPGMNWYKFLIYFLLFAGAVLNFIIGILAVTGAQYTVMGGVAADLVYQTFPGMKPLDVFYGVMCIAAAAFGIVTRFMLSSYRKIGPLFLYILYVVGIVVSLIYVAASSVVIGQSAVDATTIGSILGSAIMIVVNVIYFQKRKHLFVK